MQTVLTPAGSGINDRSCFSPSACAKGLAWVQAMIAAHHCVAQYRQPAHLFKQLFIEQL